ncbi:hypothetical protein [Streptomyces indicus]|uniref:Uncharacterized protein n=1 Tax=Streptomyces indicus TaxID=417292 RepID=A0A1G8YIX9_9ACTN|nr:hypothetical protein [Streptomyces indicus]SDK02155.1 hypothetical protein SAMN05421806_10465 [Streptomyces indicus]
MSLRPWWSLSPDDASDNGHHPSQAKPAPEPAIPVDVLTAKPLSLNGSSVRRDVYAQRGPLPDGNPTSRRIASVVHARVDRIGQLKDRIGQWHDRTMGRKPRAVRVLSPLQGDSLARWIQNEILTAPKRPVPSFGFSFVPALVHSVAAERVRHVRVCALAGATALVAVRHPWGAGTLAATMLLFQLLLAEGRLKRLARWGTGSLIAAALLAAGALLAWQQLKPHLPLIQRALSDAPSAAFWLSALLSAVYACDRWLALGYVASLSADRKPSAQMRPRLAPGAARRVAACAAAETWQAIPYRREHRVDRFVGASRGAHRNVVRIQLSPAGDHTAADTPADQEGTPGLAERTSKGEQTVMRKFEADHLLDYVRDELKKLRGHLVESHALPHCDVFEVFAVPDSEWKKLPQAKGTESEPGTHAGWPEAREMMDESCRPPSGHFRRRYLAAQVVDWDGDIVVTVFAHAALEGQTLTFVTRPHALAPLREELRVEAAHGAELVWKIVQTPLQAVGDVAVLARDVYRRTGRGLGILHAKKAKEAVVHTAAGIFDPRKAPDDKAVSLRERCSDNGIDDMHQHEDATRHISILQSSMFASASSFLADQGVETGDFRKQASQFIFVSGDNNQVNTGNLGGAMQQSNQSGKEADSKG